MGNGRSVRTLVGAKFTGEETERIDAHWRERGFSDRSDYFRSVIGKDVDSGDGGPSPLRREIEAALAPAVYVLLSCMRRVATSEQALAVVEKVYLSGDAARELDEHLARGRAEADQTPEPAVEVAP